VTAARSSARLLRRFGEFRTDFRQQVEFAVRAATGPKGGRWFELSLPGRPNGGRGWVPTAAVALHPVRNRIVVHRGARRLEVTRITDGKLLLRAPVSVGKPGAETPLGQNFYVQWRFVPADPFYGSYALETSAYSRLSDWPGGGVVGIHGTNEPQRIGQAVSHGCIRMRNDDVAKLRSLAPLGTPSTSCPDRLS
jgi:lipoprotein-anchoring transpeptidase ErfK/SrfK